MGEQGLPRRAPSANRTIIRARACATLKCLLRFAGSGFVIRDDDWKDPPMLRRPRRLRIFVAAAAIALSPVLGTAGGSLSARAAGVAVGPQPLPAPPVSGRAIPSGGQIGRPDPSPVPRPPIPPLSLLKVRPANVPLRPATNFGKPGIPVPPVGHSWGHGTPPVPSVPRTGRVKPNYATGASCNSMSPCGPLNYSNGPIVHHPLVYLIFWGPTWTTDTAEKAAMAAQEQFFNQLAGTPYDRILGQYSDGNDYPHDDIKFAGIWVDTSTPAFPVSDDLTGREAHYAAGVNGWADTPDSTFIVYPQNNTQYVTTDCGRHTYYNSGAGEYIAAYVQYDPSCRGSTIPNNMTQVASHEFFEMVTDPDTVYGFRTNSAQGKQEIGDLCSGIGENFFGVVIQTEFDNASRACRAAADGGTTIPGNSRLVDTRSSPPTVGNIQPGVPYYLHYTADHVNMEYLQVTTVNTAGSGLLRVFPYGEPTPLTSTSTCIRG